MPDQRIKSRVKQGLTSEMCEAHDLDAVSQRILRYLIEYPAARLKDLQAVTGLDISTLARRLKWPKMRAALAEISGTTDDQIARAKRAGSMRMKQIILNGEEKNAIEATKVVSVLSVGSVAVADVKPRALPSAEESQQIIADDPAMQTVDVEYEDFDAALADQSALDVDVEQSPPDQIELPQDSDEDNQ